MTRTTVPSWTTTSGAGSWTFGDDYTPIIRTIPPPMPPEIHDYEEFL